jgi:hypothetical protein
MKRLSGETPADGVPDARSACRRWRRPGMGLALVLIPLAMGSPATGGERPRSPGGQSKLGAELFNREWTPEDPRCHGGDGLGPVYNETSCVACHGLGGPGGAGPSGMNVQLISSVGDEFGAVERKEIGPALVYGPPGRGGRGLPDSIDARTSYGPYILVGGTWRPSDLDTQAGLTLRWPEITGLHFPEIPGSRLTYDDGFVDFHSSTRFVGRQFRDGFVLSANGKTLKAREFDLRTSPDGDGFLLSCAAGSITAKSFTIKPDEDALRTIHPGLVAAPSAVLHRYGVDPGYEEWRSRLTAWLRPPGVRSDRALAIPGGRILRSERNAPPLFGLGLIDDLPDEVLVATAEREPPGIRGRVSRMQSGRIGRFGWKAQTSDLREFVLGACAGELGLEVPGHQQAISPLAPDLKARALDLTPEEWDALVAYVKALPAPIRLNDHDPASIEAGRHAFEEVGCADCHRPSLGNIAGIYSDLLLHDMGPDLISVTVEVYYGPTEKVDIPTAASRADGSEWRTPPLWGYRDSGPYLHDGRAGDLMQAVKAHKGQAGDSAARFFHLSQPRQSLIERFLKSLAAPTPAEPTVIAHAKEPSERRDSLLRPASSPLRARRATALPRAKAVTQVEQERIAASRLKLAKSLEKMDKPQGALVFYGEILRDEPGTDAARIAADRIKALGGEATARQAP